MTGAELLSRLSRTGHLEREEYAALLAAHSPDLAEQAARLARAACERVYGREVYVRGLIEISNVCKNNCLYCGIRRDNAACVRYRLSEEDIFSCCEQGYGLGFRTFVLQGGEDAYFTDARLCPLLRRIKTAFPDCAVTLSLGERSRESYAALREAGADRYLLRHETADARHYASLHPPEMRYERRMECLTQLRGLGYQVGCGFMVGSPGQTVAELACDLAFVERFCPDMCGIGPFIPHRDTPFAHCPAGSFPLTLYLLSLLRIMHPHLLLPATTALGTIHPEGREMGVLCGANVVMPNLSPADARKKYELYNDKLSDGAEAAEGLRSLRDRMERIGRRVAVARGDVIKNDPKER